MRFKEIFRICFKNIFVPKVLYHGTGTINALSIKNQHAFLSSNKSKNANPLKTIDKDLIYFTPDIIEARKYSSVINAKNSLLDVCLFKVVLPMRRHKFKYLLEHKIIDVYTFRDELKFDSIHLKRVYILEINSQHVDYKLMQNLINKSDSSDLEKFLLKHKDWKLL
jgi:hypothetical protein